MTRRARPPSLSRSPGEPVEAGGLPGGGINVIAARLAEPVSTTVVARLLSLAWPVVLTASLVFAAALGGPLIFLAVFLGLPQGYELIDHWRRSP